MTVMICPVGRQAALQDPKLKGDYWSLAMLQLRLASCYRQRRDFKLASEAAGNFKQQRVFAGMFMVFI